MKDNQRKALRQWVQGVKQGVVHATTLGAVDVVHELLNDYDTLERITSKRIEFMRTALHAIISAEDIENNWDFPLRDIALDALMADTKLDNQQYKKLTSVTGDE